MSPTEPNMDQVSTHEHPPQAVRVEEAARLLGISRNAAFGLVRQGSLASFRVGTSRRIPLSAIRQFIDAATAAESEIPKCPNT